MNFLDILKTPIKSVTSLDKLGGPETAPTPKPDLSLSFLSKPINSTISKTTVTSTPALPKVDSPNFATDILKKPISSVVPNIPSHIAIPFPFKANDLKSYQGINDESNDITAAEKQIQADATKVNKDDAASIKAFNSKVEAYNNRLGNFKGAVDEYKKNPQSQGQVPDLTPEQKSYYTSISASKSTPAYAPNAKGLNLPEGPSGFGAIAESIHQGSLKPTADWFKYTTAKLVGNHIDENGNVVQGTRHEKLLAAQNLALALGTGGEGGLTRSGVNAQKIAQSVDENVIGNILRQEIPKLPEETVASFAKVFKEINTPEEVATALNRIKSQIPKGGIPSPTDTLPAPVETKPNAPETSLKQAQNLPKPRTSDQVAFQYKKQVLEPKQASGGPVVIGADDMKTHFGEDYNPQNHSMYSKAAYKLYNDAIKTNPNPVVKFTAGGPGAGKSEILVPELSKDFNGVIYDSNFSSPDGAKSQIQAARDAGKEVQVSMIVPDLEIAHLHTVIRGKMTGRNVSDETFARNHAKAVDTLSSLLEDGTLKPEEVDLYDARKLRTPKDVKFAIEKGARAPDPLAVLKKLGYREDTVYKVAQYERAKYQTPSKEQSGVRKEPISSPTQTRPDSAGGRSTTGTGGRVLRSEGTSKGEQDLIALKTQQAGLIDAVHSDPARKLAKYANQNGELPEVIGGTNSTFGTKGDSIVTELGFKDSEEARTAYENYRLKKKRLDAVNTEVKTLKDSNRILKAEDKDAKSLHSILERNAKKTDKQYPKSIVKKPQSDEALQLRKKIAGKHLQDLVGHVYKSTPEVEKTTLDGTSQITKEAYDLTLEEFEKSAAGDPLHQIVIDASTPLKKKINLLDYLRTPDRVFKKMGLDKTFNMVREGYENYLAELPLHIDLITSWSKRVSPESRKAIFRYLDGQTIKDHYAEKVHTKLAPNELEVANEIKDYLAEWADRLGLPEDNRISHYITHVFGLSGTEKEFDEELAKIIKDKVPGSVYDPFLQERLGAKGYIEDPFVALDAYVKRAVRKANMDPALDRLKTEADRLEDSQRTYLKKYAQQVNMRPSEVDTLIDNAIKQVVGYKFGQRPVAVLSRMARQLVYRSILGLNIGSAVKNLTQGVNTYAKLGERYTATGYIKILTHFGDQELKDSGIFKQDYIQDRTLSATKKGIEKVDKALFAAFDLAEKINRGAAYWGAKSKAINTGKSEEEAIQYAKKVVRDTQFNFGSVDTPVMLNSDIAKILTQFMSYGTKQTEFATEMIKNKEWVGIIRYIVASFALLYTVGETFNLKAQDFIPVTTFTKFGLPPTVAFPKAIYDALIDAPDSFGNKRTTEKKVTDVISKAPIPASLQIQKTYKGLKTYNDPKEDVPQNPGKFLKAVLLGPQNLKEDTRSADEKKYAEDLKKSEASRKTYKVIIDLEASNRKLIKAGKSDEAAEKVDALSNEDYETYKAVKLIPTVKKVQKLTSEGKNDEAQEIVDGLSDEEYKSYQFAKENLATPVKPASLSTDTPTFPDNTKTSEKGLISTIFTYAKAIGTDPVTAFDRIFSKQKIRRTDNGAIIVERMSLADSSGVKKSRGATSEMRLDHTIPLELGGSNDEDNLNLVSVEAWKSFSPIENYLGGLLRKGKITKSTAQNLIRQFKDGKITADEVKAQTK